VRLCNRANALPGEPRSPSHLSYLTFAEIIPQDDYATLSNPAIRDASSIARAPPLRVPGNNVYGCGERIDAHQFDTRQCIPAINGSAKYKWDGARVNNALALYICAGERGASRRSQALDYRGYAMRRCRPRLILDDRDTHTLRSV
jgi:hypothetical protein